jgi:hypothetical protein
VPRVGWMPLRCRGSGGSMTWQSGRQDPSVRRSIGWEHEGQIGDVACVVLQPNGLFLGWRHYAGPC